MRTASNESGVTGAQDEPAGRVPLFEARCRVRAPQPGVAGGGRCGQARAVLPVVALCCTP